MMIIMVSPQIGDARADPPLRRHWKTIKTVFVAKSVGFGPNEDRDQTKYVKKKGRPILDAPQIDGVMV